MTTTLKRHHDLPWDRVRWAVTALTLGVVLAVGLTVLLTDDATTTTRPAASADSLTSVPTGIDRVSADAAERRSTIQAVPEPLSESPRAVDHRVEAERTALIGGCISGPISPDAAERCLADR